MSSDTSPNAQVQLTREATEYVYYPTRRSIRIENGDWDRWIRTISNIPKREAIFRDIALASFGICIPSLTSAIVTMPRFSQLPSGISIIYLVIGVTTLVAGIICFVFDQKMEKIASANVETVLQDMKEVRERSVRSEETTMPASKIQSGIRR